MYRRVNETELWHLNAGCSSWPLQNFKEREHPVLAQVCRECLEIEAMVGRHRFDDIDNFNSMEANVR